MLFSLSSFIQSSCDGSDWGICRKPIFCVPFYPTNHYNLLPVFLLPLLTKMAHFFATTVQAAFDRSEANAHGIGYFLVREPLDVEAILPSTKQ